MNGMEESVTIDIVALSDFPGDLEGESGRGRSQPA